MGVIIYFSFSSKVEIPEFLSGKFKIGHCLAYVAFSFFLIAEIPLFALKFKNFSWQDNKVKYLFLIGCLALLPLGITAITAIILWYIVLSIGAWQLERAKK